VNAFKNAAGEEIEKVPKVSERQIAKTLGVSKGTINRDLGQNSPRGSKKLNKNNGAGGQNSPPTIAGQAAAKMSLRAAAKLETGHQPLTCA
jgi:transposase